MPRKPLKLPGIAGPSKGTKVLKVLTGTSVLLEAIMLDTDMKTLDLIPSSLVSNGVKFVSKIIF